MWGEIKKTINSNLNKSLDVLIQEKVTETNGKVDSKANQTSVDGIDTKIGVTNNTGGTASAGSIFAKLNKLLTDWTTTRAGYIDNINTNVDSLVNGKVVKSVQRGATQLLSSLPSNAPLVVQINAVDISKTSIFITSTTGDYLAFIRLLNSTQLELSRAGSVTISVNWQLIEFY